MNWPDGYGESTFNAIFDPAVKTNGSAPVLIDPFDIEIRDIDWLDPGFVPAHTLTIIQGHGDAGKGSWTCHLAARVTNGECLDGTPRWVVFCSAEDDHASVLKPRLIAAGADLGYVRFINQLQLPTHLEWLQQQLALLGSIAPVELCVIDPILTHLAGKVDSYKDHDVKRALLPLLDLAEQMRVTILGVHHFTKSTDAGARFAGQGSTGFGNTARSLLAMAKDDEDDSIRILEVVKSNHAASGVGRQYRLDLVEVSGLVTAHPVLRLEGPAEKSVDDVLRAAKQARDKPDHDKLRGLILHELEAGEQPIETLKKAAAVQLRITGKTVWEEASLMKDEGLLKLRKDGFNGGWLWCLSPNFPSFTAAAVESTSANFSGN